MLHDIKITSDPTRPNSEALHIDGEQYPNATAVKFEVKADRFALTSIEFLSQAFSFEGKSVISVTDETAALLAKLGWTAPEAA